MTSLTEKRAAAYHHSLGGTSHNSSLGQINLNTDELETKMDSVIVNTNHSEFTGTSTISISASSTANVISAVDLGSGTAPHKINIVGTTTDTNIECIFQVSNDNITYYDLPHFINTVVGTKFSGIGDICFRYFKLNVKDNSGTTITVVVEYCAKNI
tara:strand:+ start:380 stop:847 length:468 start_codon:yes stop_codon:yes gene_type:complete